MDPLHAGARQKGRAWDHNSWHQDPLAPSFRRRCRNLRQVGRFALTASGWLRSAVGEVLNCPGFSGERSVQQRSRKLKGRCPFLRESIAEIQKVSSRTPRARSSAVQRKAGHSKRVLDVNARRSEMGHIACNHCGLVPQCRCCDHQIHAVMTDFCAQTSPDAGFLDTKVENPVGKKYS